MADGALLKVWETYQAAWSNVSEDKRRELLSVSVSDDFAYSDPTNDCRGVGALIAHIKILQSRMPGASFRNDKFLDHHRQGLSQWTMFDGEEREVASGTSYARFGRNGKLMQATGFFETKS